jgi:nitrogen regulation protein NR(I)
MNGQALRIWLVDDDASIRWVLERALRNGGMTPRAFEAAEPALDALRRESPDVLITDIRMPGQSGLELLKKIRDARPALPVIVMTAHSDLGSAVSAYEGGAFEYLPKPFDIDQAVALVRRAANAHPQGGGDSATTPRIPELLGRAPAMQQVFRAIGRLARSSVTVLITGESGTGKELVARALHDHSPRAGKPFIALNTSAIPADLLESELFGHEKGAFTGADSQRRGRFEQSDGGTLFLDEIGDLPLESQASLLRFLQERKVERLGGHGAIDVDVRIISATHVDMTAAMIEGRFRSDLYHRLCVLQIDEPPLRARGKDIELLARHMLERFKKDASRRLRGFAPDAIAALHNYGWPGNVRELINRVRRAIVMSEGRAITARDLELAEYVEIVPVSLAQAREAAERQAIELALLRHRGRLGDAAQELGISRVTLYRLLCSHGMRHMEGEPMSTPHGELPASVPHL